MWICEKCNEENEDSFDTCWKCFKGSELEKQQIEEYNTSEDENRRAKSKSFYSKLGVVFLSVFICLFLLKIPVFNNFFPFIIISIVLYYILKAVLKKKQ